MASASLKSASWMAEPMPNPDPAPAAPQAPAEPAEMPPSAAPESSDVEWREDELDHLENIAQPPRVLWRTDSVVLMVFAAGAVVLCLLIVLWLRH